MHLHAMQLLLVVLVDNRHCLLEMPYTADMCWHCNVFLHSMSISADHHVKASNEHCCARAVVVGSLVSRTRGFTQP